MPIVVIEETEVTTLNLSSPVALLEGYPDNRPVFVKTEQATPTSTTITWKDESGGAATHIVQRVRTDRRNRNYMTITVDSGWSDQIITDYPLQFGRCFLEGEIDEYPQILIDGTPISTQADVKSRWQDGSVRFAILSAEPSIAHDSGEMEISFQNQSSAYSGSPVSIEDDLESQEIYAEMRAYDSVNTLIGSPNISDMYFNDHRETLISGSICVGYKLCDLSETRTYDFGTDSNKSLTPIIYLYKWNSGRVWLRFVVEQSNVSVVQDQRYKIDFYGRNGLSLDLLDSQPLFDHYGHQRWSYKSWMDGSTLPKLKFWHNASYIGNTGALPAIPRMRPRLLGTDVTAWQSSWDNSGGSSAKWSQNAPWSQTSSPNSGGLHWHVGPMQSLNAFYLRRGDRTYTRSDNGQTFPLHDAAFRSADNYPYQVFFRESQTERNYAVVPPDSPGTGIPGSVTPRYFIRGSSELAIGKFISMHARPTFWFFYFTSSPYFRGLWQPDASQPPSQYGPVYYDGLTLPGNYIIDSQDCFFVVGTFTRPIAAPDKGHNSTPGLIEYLMTGDEYYRETFWFQQTAAFHNTQRVINTAASRGPFNGALSHNTEGGNRLVGNALQFNAACFWIADDNTVEQTYWKHVIKDNLARMEFEHKAAFTAHTAEFLSDPYYSQFNAWVSPARGTYFHVPALFSGSAGNYTPQLSRFYDISDGIGGAAGTSAGFERWMNPSVTQRSMQNWEWASVHYSVARCQQVLKSVGDDAGDRILNYVMQNQLARFFNPGLKDAGFRSSWPTVKLSDTYFNNTEELLSGWDPSMPTTDSLATATTAINDGPKRWLQLSAIAAQVAVDQGIGNHSDVSICDELSLLTGTPHVPSLNTGTNYFDAWMDRWVAWCDLDSPPDVVFNRYGWDIRPPDHPDTWDWADIAEVNAGVQTYTDTTALTNISYAYRVIANEFGSTLNDNMPSRVSYISLVDVGGTYSIFGDPVTLSIDGSNPTVLGKTSLTAGTTTLAITTLKSPIQHTDTSIIEGEPITVGMSAQSAEINAVSDYGAEPISVAINSQQATGKLIGHLTSVPITININAIGAVDLRDLSANYYYVSTGGSGSGAGTIEDPFTPSQVVASSPFQAGTYILFKDTDVFTGQQYIIRDFGTPGKFITYSKYGDTDRDPIITYDQDHVFKITGSNYVRFINLSVKSESGYASFSTVGEYDNIKWIDCGCPSAGSFLINTGGYNCYGEIIGGDYRYSIADMFRFDAGNWDFTDVNISKAGFDTGENENATKNIGSAISLTGQVGRVRYERGTITNCKTVFRGAQDTGEFICDRVKMTYVGPQKLVGTDWTDHLMISQASTGTTSLRNCIIYSSGDHAGSILFAGVYGTLSAINCGIVDEVNNKLASTYVNLGNMTLYNNIFELRTPINGSSRSISVNFGQSFEAGFNQYVRPTLDYNASVWQFFAEDWLQWNTREVESIYQFSDLAPHKWYLDPENATIPIYSTLINAGTNKFDITQSDFIGHPRPNSGPWSIGPFAVRITEDKKYGGGVYNRYGNTPS